MAAMISAVALNNVCYDINVTHCFAESKQGLGWLRQRQSSMPSYKCKHNETECERFLSHSRVSLSDPAKYITITTCKNILIKLFWESVIFMFRQIINVFSKNAFAIMIRFKAKCVPR